MPYGVFNSIETVLIGGWFVIIGYFFILFIYFMAFRFKRSRNPFHLGFGLFFLLLGSARAFFLVYDYYDPQVLWWSLATAVSWAAIFTVFFALTYQVLEKQLWQVILVSLPPLIIAIAVLVFPFAIYPEPTVPLGYMISNYVILPIYSIVLPLLFFYIGMQVLGKLRTSNFLIGGGFLIYYVGRIFQSSQVVAFLNLIIPFFGTLLAPLLVFVALILIALGVLLEETE